MVAAEKDEIFFCFVVFSAFSMFGPGVTESDIASYFGSPLSSRVQISLDRLLAMGLIRRDGVGYSQVANRAFDPVVNKMLSHLDFLRCAMDDALERLGTWYRQPNQSHIESSVLAVRSADYLSLLPRIRAQVEGMQGALQSQRADCLLHFNVQIYPEKPILRP